MSQPKVGDKVTRMLAGKIPMELEVTEIDDYFIHCGPWKFDKTWGYEVDEALGWGIGDDIITGSYIVLPDHEHDESVNDLFNSAVDEGI